MTCVICEAELVEEREEIYISNTTTAYKRTGYLYCPSCGLVYKEKE